MDLVKIKALWLVYGLFAGATIGWIACMLTLVK